MFDLEDHFERILGALANVNRNPGVVNARRQIGEYIYTYIFSYAVIQVVVHEYFVAVVTYLSNV